MDHDNKKVFIVYFSPSGSTYRVARIIENRFQVLASDVSVFDLKAKKDLPTILSPQIRKLKEQCCLFIGSPVYVSHAVPPIMHFISGLPERVGAFAVPFVTWGGASSGIALYEMGRELINKGFTILGAAKVLAVHSLMWQLENPLGMGRPDSEDTRGVQELVNHIYNKLHRDNSKGIQLSDLAYQSRENHAEMEKISLETAKAHMPIREVDVKLCAQCQTCAEVCPTDAIAFSPYPQFGKKCIFCLNCMKNCPEGAIKADLSGIWQRIKDRADFFNEQPYTQIFI